MPEWISATELALIPLAVIALYAVTLLIGVLVRPEIADDLWVRFRIWWRSAVQSKDAVLSASWFKSREHLESRIEYHGVIKFPVRKELGDRG